MQDGFSAAASLLPQRLRCAADGLSGADKSAAEEFRLRNGQPPTVLLPGGERQLICSAVSAEDLLAVTETATRASFYAAGDTLRRGFVAAPGGVRIGVCGTAVTEKEILSLRELSSLAIRIPRQVKNVGREAVAAVKDGSVLIFAPPGGGKTTFLRELVRTASEDGKRVSLCDERGEIAGMYCGTPQFDVGRCTDVLTGAPKAEGALMLLRAMNPQIVAMDEISAPEDAKSIVMLRGCGVQIYATVHAAFAEEFAARPMFRELLEQKVFQFSVRISGAGQARQYRVDRL